MHNDRLITRGGVASSALVPSPAILRRMDQAASESINGDGGGTWTPSKPIIIGGSGLAISAAGGFTGPLSTGPGALPGALVLGDSDWPSHAARTRTVVFPIQDTFNSADYSDVAVTAVPLYDQSVPGAFRIDVASTIFYLPLDMKHFPPGATIASVTARFRVGKRPTAVPGVLPRIYFDTDPDAGISDNAFLPTPATPDAYYNAGLAQDLQVVPISNTTVALNTNYFVHIIDGSLTKNIYHSIVIAFSNILDMRPAL